jgi:5'-nucleotidase
MQKEIARVALFDMDGTLCDYDSGLFAELEKMRAPNDPVYRPPLADDAPAYVKARTDLIRRSERWWAELPRLKLGFEVWNLAGELGYVREILTQGPRRNPYAWSGKKIWIDRNLGEDVDITITRNKSRHYGKVLVDDFPEYVLAWLEHRPRGIAIVPANPRNEGFSHPQVLRYDGTNFDELRECLTRATVA